MTLCIRYLPQLSLYSGTDTLKCLNVCSSLENQYFLKIQPPTELHIMCCSGGGWISEKYWFSKTVDFQGWGWKKGMNNLYFTSTTLIKIISSSNQHRIILFWFSPPSSFFIYFPLTFPFSSSPHIHSLFIQSSLSLCMSLCILKST